MRPDLSAAAAPRSALTEGQSLSGPRVTSAAGDPSLEPMPGSWPAAGALLIDCPAPRGAC